jgi:hypothetical protein
MRQTDKKAREQEALSRAVGSLALSNYPAIFHGFMEKGIPEADILPRQNVFTFDAWRALGRTVKRGEHGVRVLTWVDVERKVTDKDGIERLEPSKRPWMSTVFHVSQTEALAN